MKPVHQTLLCLAIFAGIGLPHSAAGADDLAEGFGHPAAAYRPDTWWRWINGNISREAITRDLGEMSRHGIRGAGIFDVTGPAPVAPVGAMGPEWQADFQHAVKEAARLGLEIRMSPAAGWGIGGPWITERDATKTLRVVEVQAEGAGNLDILLPRAVGKGAYYRDVAVVAVREESRPPTPLTVTASSTLGGYQDEKNWPATDACDGDPATYWKSARAPSMTEPAWLELRFPVALVATSMYLAGAETGGPSAGELQMAEDGKTFHPLVKFNLKKGEAKHVVFPPAKGSVFRLSITAAHAPDVQLAEFQILRDGDEAVSRLGIKWWWFKSANRAFWDWPKDGPAILDEEWATVDSVPAVRAADVVDLTSRLSPEGRLQWRMPPGRWTIMRFGSVLLGECSRWASQAAPGGFEADPYSSAAAETLYQESAGRLVRGLSGPPVAFKGIEVDSYEIGATAAGLQGTWTDDFRSQFRKRRGYDLLPFLPALARRLVDSREVTNRFLWDYRQTLAELYLEFYGRLATLAHRDGLQLRAENGYGSYPFPHIDGLAAFGRCDEPMGEFWYNRTILSQFFNWADSVRTAASAAHIYGRNRIAAEALTIANGAIQAPGAWKTHVDREFCNGANSLTLNCWSLQYDLQARPGLYTYDLINENMTWWEQSRAFLDYISRCQYLLQQGTPVADFCYFFGEGTAKFVPSRDALRPGLPQGHDFDGINAEVIEQRLTSAGGLWQLPEGGSYRYLVLPDRENWRVSLSLLRKMQTLVEGGATLVGHPPGGTPGLDHFPQADAEVRALAAALWGKGGVHPVGNGRVIENMSPAEVLALDAVKPDVDLAGMSGGTGIVWCHRRTATADIYFLSNQDNQAKAGAVTFRVAGKRPEFWDPADGKAREAVSFSALPGQTQVPLELPPNASVFVVFRKSAGPAVPEGTNALQFTKVLDLAQSWTVQFTVAAGGPSAPVNWPELKDWSQDSDLRIRYYSGTAIYRGKFDLQSGIAQSDRRMFLDLGIVKELARIRLNGADLGVVWTAPWRVEVTGKLRPGGNDLEIEVTNLWTNRLIGDQSIAPAQQITKTNLKLSSKHMTLLPSGLLGPLTLSIGKPATISGRD